MKKADNTVRINYQKELDRELKIIKSSGKKPRLLLHVCCAPCSSYVLEYLNGYFDITAFYYNPNITVPEEFEKRAGELRRFISEAPFCENVKAVIPPHEPEAFLKAVSGLENEPEGGRRCFACYALRLERSCLYALENGFDYFTTTLSISPLKDAQRLNMTGKMLSEQYGVRYLYSDFKKKNGYKRSVELSSEYSLYRQNYCGCEYSRNN